MSYWTDLMDVSLVSPDPKLIQWIDFKAELFSETWVVGVWDFDHQVLLSGRVAELPNRKAGGLSLTQTNSARQPSSETNPTLGRKVGRFTRGDLENMTSLVPSVPAAPCSIIVSAKPDSLTPGDPQQMVAGFFTSSASRQAVAVSVGTVQTGSPPQARAWQNDGQAIATIGDNVWSRFMATRAALNTPPRISVNGGEITVGSTPTTNFTSTANFSLVSTTFPYDGLIDTIMLCNVDLLDPAQASKRERVEEFFLMIGV